MNETTKIVIQRQIESLMYEVEAIESDMQNLKGAIAERKQKLDLTEFRINELKQSLREAQDRINELKQSLREAQDKEE